MKEYRAVHLTMNIPGPLALSRLAKDGVHVTKVEPPSGDPLESHCPEWYRSLHQGQTVVKLDLKQANAKEKLAELLRDAHLFVTSLRATSLENLALNETSLRKSFPKLQIIRILGYPSPRENLPAHDLNCQAEAGLLSPPTLPRALIADFAAAERIYSTSLLALLKLKSAPGSIWMITLSEMAQEFAIPLKFGMTSSDGPLGGSLPQYNVYEAQDGWIAVAALEAHFLKKLLAILGLEAPDHTDFVRIFKTKTKAEWRRIAEMNDIPISLVR